MSVVGMRSSVMLSPEAVLAGRQADPAEQLLDPQIGADRPLTDIVNHLVTRIGGKPATFQGSPIGFFAAMFSSMN